MSKLFSTLPSSLKIGVLRGGYPPENDLSIKSGAHVLKVLSDTHSPIDIFISKDGTWHIQGVERSPERILKSVDVVWNSLHGNFGEDGGVQDFLQNHGVKFTGSGRYSSAIAANKFLAKEHLIPHGIKTPVHKLIKKGEDVLQKAKEVWSSMVHPFALKPAKGGSAFGFTVVESFDDLAGALEYLLQNHESVLVEEFIPGTSVSCLVTEGFRGHELYAFPSSLPLNREDAEVVEDYAKKVHKILNLSHYSQSDFIVSPRRGIYFLEVNTVPKLTEKSLAGKAIESVGSSPKEFVHHVISLTI